MSKTEYAQVEIRPAIMNGLMAWADGKLLGVVHTDGDGVYVRLIQKTLRRSSAVDRGVEAAEPHELAIRQGEELAAIQLARPKEADRKFGRES